MTKAPTVVIINFKNSRVPNMSGIEALNKLTKHYRLTGKTLYLKYLSNDCKELLLNADAIIDVNILEDTTYKVVSNWG